MDPDTTLTAPLPLPSAYTERDAAARSCWHAEPIALSSYVSSRESWADVRDDDVLTEPCMALTAELTALEAPTPLDEPLMGDPAYLVEARRVDGATMLIAVRATLGEAVVAAGTVHPGVADVAVREMPLPCDAASLVRVMGEMRTWTREPDGTWWPPLPDFRYYPDA